jgi:soluble lytic murein transglycosylase-like protein
MAICFRIGVAAGFAAVSLYAGAAAGNFPQAASTVKPDWRTGRLVRTMRVAPHPAAPAPSRSTLKAAVEQAAYRHVLPVDLLHSVIKVESNYNPWAVSPKGAMGLMQLVPSTARRFGVEHPFDPLENLEGGARYLRHLLDLYGNYPLALAAYNAGEDAVARHRGIPPFPETRNYLVQVKRALDELQQAPSVALAVAPAAETGSSDGYNHIEEVVGPDGRAQYISR